MKTLLAISVVAGALGTGTALAQSNDLNAGLPSSAGAATAPIPPGKPMYKWTDERGVTQYSNTPPPSTARSKVAVVEERVSVYTPDKETMRLVEQEAIGNKRAARQEVQREAEQRSRERQAAQQRIMEAQRKAAYDKCVADRRVECETILAGTPSGASYGYTGYYGPSHVVGAALNPPRPFAVLDPGPQNRIGVSNAPPVGISTAPPVGISTAPKVGIDDRPPVGAPPRSRTVGQFR